VNQCVAADDRLAGHDFAADLRRHRSRFWQHARGQMHVEAGAGSRGLRTRSSAVVTMSHDIQLSAQRVAVEDEQSVPVSDGSVRAHSWPGLQVTDARSVRLCRIDGLGGRTFRHRGPWPGIATLAMTQEAPTWLRPARRAGRLED
jgi:hypothetical protein